MSRFLLFVSFLAVSGCASTLQYKPAYIIPNTSNMPATIQGKALVVTQAAKDNKTHPYHPSSWTGSATSINVPLNLYLRKISMAIFSKRFENGAEHTETIPRASSYAIVVVPEILDFDYRYNQLKNWGFAITPEVKLEILAQFYNSAGRKLSEHRYASDYRTLGNYVILLNPPERINQTIHTTLAELVAQMATDAGIEVSSNEASRANQEAH